MSEWSRSRSYLFIYMSLPSSLVLHPQFFTVKADDSVRWEPVPNKKPKKAEKCGIYFAPSTIPGAGMGMFAGDISYEPGDMVADSDLVIPVFELDWHNGHQKFSFLWNEYTWSPTMFEGFEQEAEDIEELHACSPGFGAAVNCRLNLVNVEDADDTWQISTSGVSSESPGAGAFTPYFGRQFQAKKYIPPGMELYVSYGEGYFKSRSAYEKVPLKKSYKNADTFLRRFRKLKHKVPYFNIESDEGNALYEELYKMVVHDFPFKSRATYALPNNVSLIAHVLNTGGTANATYNESIRSLEWLEEHGQCMDNIKDGKSTLSHAGRGAFANRFIPQGGIVSPAPLIQIGNRSIFTMYKDQKNADGLLERNVARPIHQQLLLNYCFGHRDTALLLCPYGLLTLLINHNHYNFNAKVVWSKNLRHPEWLNQSYHAWYDEKHSGLSFDIIATRDIEEDEEIFIDYGEEWEIAWQEHVAQFEAPRRGYMPAFEMNNQVDLQIKTTDEIDYEGIEGVYTFCRKTYVDIALGKRDALVDQEEMKPEVFDLNSEGCYACHVVHRNHNDSYIAELFTRETKDHSTGRWQVSRDHAEYVVFDVPRDTFYFHDAFYSRDHSQTWSFRHDMRIPDEIFPDAWRDSLHAPTLHDDSERKEGEGTEDPQKELQKPSKEESRDSLEKQHQEKGEASDRHQGKKKVVVEGAGSHKPVGRQRDDEL